MAAITATRVEPVAVIGNLRIRSHNVTAAADTNTFDASKEFSQVLFASFTPEVSGITHGIALSGAGNITLTFKLSAPITAGKLVIIGL